MKLTFPQGKITIEYPDAIAYNLAINPKYVKVLRRFKAIEGKLAYLWQKRDKKGRYTISAPHPSLEQADKKQL